ncbi:unnamed protein product [Alternaria alternata]
MGDYADPLDHILAGNLAYQKRTTARDPNAFTLLAQGQAPEILWIGCADSRIPETTVCHCKPGEIFVHRNIANTVHADDLNAASVVEYAVTHLKVNRVVNKVELEELPNDDARSARVAELNVQQSIDVLKQHPAIKRAIANRGLSLHGLIYDIGAGQLKILEEAGGRKADSLRCLT